MHDLTKIWKKTPQQSLIANILSYDYIIQRKQKHIDKAYYENYFLKTIRTS